ncbi:hypothetical protein [Shewanella maritima]|uniref:hypothetical protein n=1 Tax=Shewanella maritima TaxID=2520507 RepID=UPI00373701C5
MIRYLATCLLCLLSILATDANSQEVIKIQSPKSEDNLSHRYFVDLLTLILQETKHDYGEVKLVQVDGTVSQSRGFSMLTRGSLDVFWAGTNVQREARFSAIKVPLIGGLLGYRMPVIRYQDADKFGEITQATQLQSLVACQGAQWPDSDILELNQYHVTRVITFGLIYEMLEQGRCDYFPRGLNEVYPEVAGKPDLVAFENILLHYPLPMYFFTSKGKPQLSKRLNKGMQKLVESGDLIEFIENHPTTRDIFPLTRYSGSHIFELNNPLLPPNTETNNAAMWLTIPRH